jgi:hypothetical protein
MKPTFLGPLAFSNFCALLLSLDVGPDILSKCCVLTQNDGQSLICVLVPVLTQSLLKFQCKT